jgi:hypothetical protein
LGIVDTHFYIQGTGDFNGDGKADILWRNTNGDAFLWNSNSGSGYTGFTGQNLGTVDTHFFIQGTGDFNGDGKADILWRNTNGDTVLWNSSPGSGFTGFTGQNLGMVNLSYYIQGVGDFNGDGKADILWRSTNGDTVLWNSNPGSGFTGFTGQDLGIVDPSYLIEGVGDFNGDGKAGILWRSTSGDVVLWNSTPGAGFTGFTGQDLGIVDAGWQIQGAGDYNGDGKADILWRYTNGDTLLWNSNPGSGYTGFTGQDLSVVDPGWNIFHTV